MNRRVGSLASAGAIIVGSLTAAGPVAAKGPLDVLLEDLASPKAIFVDGRSAFVGQGWFGEDTGPILEFRFAGRGHGTAEPVTDPVHVTDIVGTPDGAGWAIGLEPGAEPGMEGAEPEMLPHPMLFRESEPGGPVEAVLDIADYQAADPDPYNNPEEDPAETNPNGLAALPSSDVLLVDAANNDLIRVSPDGEATTVARWAREEISTAGVDDPDLPATLPAEAVPTTVAIGRDGWAYVGQLMGFPGTPGTSHIWRVNPDAEDAVCSVEIRDPDCSVWKSGFTSIFDMAFNPNNWTLYVYEIAEDSWVAFEEGFETGDFPPAVLLRVRGDRMEELVRGQLSEPGGVAVSRSGRVFVTDGMFSGGRLLEIRGA